MKFNPSILLDPEIYDHQVVQCELIETHISWVILTGYYAYKVKKPVDFGFLDFTTLGKRRHYCEQELLLNRRMAADIYLDVVSISGSEDKPRLNGKGKIFEYAVKMLQFPKSSEFDVMLAAGLLDEKHMSAIADKIADFHQHITIADEFIKYGDVDVIFDPVKENFKLIRQHPSSKRCADELAKLERWSHLTFESCSAVFKYRKRAGFVRECHGDMHLRNLIWFHDGPIAFDCIEFNTQLRWIDVISDISFLLMDLQSKNQSQLANHFLNRYLEKTGDYAGLSVMPFYLAYRALVRAKVEVLSLELESATDEEHHQALLSFESYLKLAMTYTVKTTPKLIIMRGVSASGKSFFSQKMIDAQWGESTPILRIRSDVERKRLLGVDSDDASEHSAETAEIESGLYSRRATVQTYKRLLELATHVINAGYSVIVDATFQKYEQRNDFKRLAENCGARFIIVELSAPVDILKQRINNRKNDVSDADMVVLEHQLSHWKPLHDNELCDVITVDTDEEIDMQTLTAQLNRS